MLNLTGMYKKLQNKQLHPHYIQNFNRA